ncbi:MAG: chorismate mutase [Eubacteriaceae bacterium]|nr:chorismate mutase [Eubacteriaceae bacterium]
MKSLELIRKNIDEIDEEMRVLFEKRMGCIKEVAEYKFKNNEKLFDPKREEIIIEKNIKLLKNEEYNIAYVIFIHVLMDSSKEFQKEWMKFQEAKKRGNL